MNQGRNGAAEQTEQGSINTYKAVGRDLAKQQSKIKKSSTWCLNFELNRVWHQIPPFKSNYLPQSLINWELCETKEACFCLRFHFLQTASILATRRVGWVMTTTLLIWQARPLLITLSKQIHSYFQPGWTHPLSVSGRSVYREIKNSSRSLIFHVRIFCAKKTPKH